MYNFRTIVADPPWRYRNKTTGGSMTSGSKDKYPTMALDDICGLPVHEISDPRGSMLFLWATVPLLDEALDVMKSWGFRYLSSLYWDKQKYGLGYWWRGTMEQCLVGMRGHVKAYRCQKVNLIREKAREHSRKPVAFWELVEPYASEPRIELFCRGSPRYGWHGWGSDCSQVSFVPALDSYMEYLVDIQVLDEHDTPAPPYESQADADASYEHIRDGTT
jgi:N6-adenosine-specific RNA methylase IME4